MRVNGRRWLVPCALVPVFLLVVAGCGGTAPPPAGTPLPAEGAPPPPGTPGGPPADPRIGGQPPDDALAAGWRYRFDLVSPPNERNAIRDRVVDLFFWPDTTRVWFQLENRLGSPLKILWDEFRFRDTDNRVFKVVHEGITYERRYETLDYTLVSGNQRVSDWFAPVDLLEDPTAVQGGGMRLLFPTDASAQSYVGKTFSTTFVLEYEGQPRQYDLVFKVTSVIPPR